MKIDQASKLITLIDKQVYIFFARQNILIILVSAHRYPYSFNFMPHILYFFATLYFDSPSYVYKNCIQSLKRFEFMLQNTEHSNSTATSDGKTCPVHVVVLKEALVQAKVHDTLHILYK